jgi:hypothetical protein
MPKQLVELRERLLRAGVAPRHVRRYLTELTEHFTDLNAEEERAGRNSVEAEAFALNRLGSMEALADAMIGKRQLQSWTARAPWAVFGLVPLASLAAAWFVALFILWSGWHLYLPDADTPFGGGPHNGFVNLYFQFGRMVYFWSPFVIGWGIGFIAIRQRLSAVWPAIGVALLAYLAGTAQVHASQKEVSNGLGHIVMGFGLGSHGQSVPAGLTHIVIILTVTMLPYLVWRLRNSSGISA